MRDTDVIKSDTDVNITELVQLINTSTILNIMVYLNCKVTSSKNWFVKYKRLQYLLSHVFTYNTIQL